GEALTADAAEAAGLINAVIPSETLYEHAAAKAATLAAKPRAAMANTKALMRHDTPQVLEAMAREATLFAQALTSPEAKAAFQAFLSKGR
ncbi:enoyl-CoA hydratase-related protein, partial [Nitrospirillum viridazoti]